MANIYRFRRRRLKRLTGRSGSAHRVRWRLFLSAFALFVVAALGAVALVVLFVYRSYADDLVPPTELISSTGTGSSVVVDRDGRFLFEFLDPLAGLRDPIELEEISDHLINATVATEDATFFDNPGVNLRGLVRAARENLPAPLGQGFGEGSGGSSITQQLVKNVYIEPEKRFDRRAERKIKEIVLAIELRRQYDANQILEWYLNQIDYGNLAHGVEAASNRYFGKSTKELTLAEAAMLAGIPKAPTLITPVLPENRERAVQRQHEVLSRMVEEGYISQAQADEARAEVTEEPLDFGTFKLETLEFDINAPHFVFYVQEIINKMCEKGLFDPPDDLSCDKALLQGGLSVTTSLDLQLQRIGEATVEEILSANEATTGGHNGSIVAIDPNTGEILAMVGSRDFFDEDIQGQVDITTSQRSHGSTMKAFTYLTAFKQGWVPSTMVNDAPLLLAGNPVNNWNFAHLGNITVRKAVAQSVNVAAVRTVMELGEDKVKATAHQLGITDMPDSRFCGPTITLGSCEVKALDMVFAYATIANNGVMKGMPTVEDLPDGFREVDPVSVLKITDREGEVLYEYTAPATQQAIDPAYAYMLVDILSNDAIRWSQLTLPFPAAAKTGTSEEFRDSVLLGFTPDLAVGVWMGNSDGTVMADRTFSSSGAGPMWSSFMIRAHEYLGLSGRGFSAPDSIVLAQCKEGSELFVKDISPPEARRLPGPVSEDPPIPHEDTYAHANPHPDADTHADSYSHPDADSYSHSGADTHADSYSHPDADTHTDPDANSRASLTTCAMLGQGLGRAGVSGFRLSP